MNQRKKRGKILPRRSFVRDARLFVIAVEGAVTEPEYFKAFKQGQRIKVEVLPTGKDNQSSPEAVLQRLRSFKEKSDLLNDDDIMWLVIDVDRWGAKKLAQTCKSAREAGYKLAVSNPCFETWLWLHHKDADEIKSATCPQIKTKLKVICSQENKSYSDVSFCTRERVNQAISRAKSLHFNKKELWPNTVGSHVYILVEDLLKFGCSLKNAG